MSTLDDMYAQTGRPVPEALSDWEARVYDWCDEYEAQAGGAEVSEINRDFAVFLFDHVAERVVLAYALSVEQLLRRDTARMRGFPSVNAGVARGARRPSLLRGQGPFSRSRQRGHSGHQPVSAAARTQPAAGRAEGKRFRAMERYVADPPGNTK